MSAVRINAIPHPISVMKINVKGRGKTVYSSHIMIFMWVDELCFQGKSSVWRRTAVAQVPPDNDLNWRIGRNPELLEKDLHFNGPCPTIDEDIAKILMTLWSTRYEVAELPPE
jgi:hypothetical protein